MAARAVALSIACLVGAPASALAQSPAAPSAEVIGGTAAPAGSWDFAAYVVEHDSTGSGSCTGSVVAPNVVLTAAHCVLDEHTDQPLDPSAFTITTGTLDLGDGGAAQVSKVTSVSVGPGFSFRTLRPDEAVLVLATPTTAPSIPLATSADTALYTPGAAVVLAGWGLVKAGNRDTPKELQTTNTQLQSDSACSLSAAGAPIDFQPGWMLCTAGGGIACKGDSGGPIIAPVTPSPASLSDWRLIGTTSWGDNTCGYLSVAASVLPLSAWITQQIGAAAGAAAGPAAAIGTIATPLGLRQAAPTVRVPIHLQIALVGHGKKWFRLKIVATPRSPIDRLHVKLQYFTGYGFRSFASFTVVSGKPAIREFSGDRGHYDVRAVVAAGPGWTAATSKKEVFTLR
jgi:hypothetical protein